MKKLHTILCILFMSISSITFSQVNKGALFLGGDIGGNTTKTTSNGTITNRQNGLWFSPVIGKAIKENLILGGELNFWFNENNNPTPGTDQRQKQYGAGIFLRKYKPLGNSNFSAFIQGKLNGTRLESEVKYPGVIDESNRTTINLIAMPGISYAVSRRFQLEAGLNNFLNLMYYREKRNPAGSFVPAPSTTTNFGFSSSLFNPSSLYFGFRFLVNKKEK